jgi:5-methylcytosine-specific restriction protein A
MILRQDETDRVTGRSLPEWRGRTADTAVPERVQRRVFDAWAGRCYLSGREIDPVRDIWQIEHVKALCNGGENRESNLAPALVEPHQIKTRADRAEKDKVERIRRKHLGLHKSAHPLRHPTLRRRMDGTVERRVL